MYIKGASRRSVAFWSRHLQDTVQNLRAEVVDKRGLAADDLRAMMLEMQEDAQLTRCKNFMYIASFNPCPHEHPTERQWEQMYEIFEKHRGIPAGQQRIVIEHEKEGRIHRHVVWNRVDLEQMRAFPDGLDLKVCEAAEHEIERELGLERTPGFLDRDSGMPPPQPNPKSYEMFRGMKTGIDPRDVTAEVTAIFRESENAADFVEGLRQHGYQFVKGNRAFCILDSAGNDHSLARRIEGINTRELRTFMQGMDLTGIPTVEQGKALHQERKIAALEADRATVQHQIEWEEALAKAAIEKEKAERRFVAPEPGRDAATDGRKKEREAERQKPPAPELGRTAGEIRLAYSLTNSGMAFARALEDRGLILARVTAEDAQRLAELEIEDQRDNTAPRSRAGEPPITASIRSQFEDAGREATRPDSIQSAPENHRGAEAGEGPRQDNGPWMRQQGGVEKLSPAQHDSARRSYDSWWNKGRFSFENYVAYVQKQQQKSPGQEQGFRPRFREGDLVVVNQYGNLYGLTQRNTADDFKARTEHLKEIDSDRLLSVADAQAVMQDVQRHRQEESLWPAKEKHWPIHPPQPEPIRTSPAHHFEDAARATTQPEREPVLPEKLKGAAAHIWMAYNNTRDAQAFAAVLEERGISLAVTTEEEAGRSYREAAFAKQIGNYAPSYREGEIVAVTESARVYRLNERTTGADRAGVEKFLARLDRTPLQSIEATQQMMHDRAAQREAAAQLFSLLNPVRQPEKDPRPNARPGRVTAANNNTPAVLGKVAVRALDGLLNIGGGLLAHLDTPKSPELQERENREGEKATHERNAEAEHKIDFSRYTAEPAQEQRNEQERQAARNRQRDIDRER